MFHPQLQISTKRLFSRTKGDHMVHCEENQSAFGLLRKNHNVFVWYGANNKLQSTWIGSKGNAVQLTKITSARNMDSLMINLITKHANI